MKKKTNQTSNTHATIGIHTVIGIVLIAILTSSLGAYVTYSMWPRAHAPTGISLAVAIYPRNIKLSVNTPQTFHVTVFNGTEPYEIAWMSNGTHIGSESTVSFAFDSPCAFTILSVEVSDANGISGYDATYVYDPATINIYLDDLPATASYTVKTDGTYYWAVKYDGDALWESTNASEVLESVTAACTSGELIVLRNGVYDLDVTWTLDDYANVRGESFEQTILRPSSASVTPLIQIGEVASGQMVEGVSLQNVKIDMRDYASSVAINLSNVKTSFFETLWLTNWKHAGFFMEGYDTSEYVFWNTFRDIMCYGTDADIGGALFHMEDNCWDLFFYNTIGGMGEGTAYQCFGGGALWVQNAHHIGAKMLNLTAINGAITEVRMEFVNFDTLTNTSVFLKPSAAYDVAYISIQESWWTSPPANYPLIDFEGVTDGTITGCRFTNLRIHGTASYTYFADYNGVGAFGLSNKFYHNDIPTGASGLYHNIYAGCIEDDRVIVTRSAETFTSVANGTSVAHGIVGGTPTEILISITANEQVISWYGTVNATHVDVYFSIGTASGTVYASIDEWTSLDY